MKILHAAETIRGGVATVMRHHLDAQTERFGANHVTALVPEDQAGDLGPRQPGQIATFQRTGRNRRSFLSFLSAFRRCVRDGRPDIIHLHSSFAGALGRMALLPFWRRRPCIVYCPHGWAFLMDGSALKKRGYALVERLLAPLADAIICVSEYERRTALQYGLPNRKLRVIHNGVPIPAEDSFPARDPCSAGSMRLLFVGRLDYAKGFDLLMQAMRELEGEAFHLTVAGSAVLDAGVPPSRPNVTYAGWVPAAEIPALYCSADVLVMPSRWEGFPLAPLEAAQHGLATLAADCCSLPEIVLDNRTGCLFPTGNVAEMVQQLRRTTPMEWHRMGQAARRHVQDNFNVELMTAATLELYDKVAD